MWNEVGDGSGNFGVLPKIVEDLVWKNGLEIDSRQIEASCASENFCQGHPTS